MIRISQSSTQTLFLSQLVPGGGTNSVRLIVDPGVSVSVCNDLAGKEKQSIECIVGDYAQLTYVHIQSDTLVQADIAYRLNLGYKTVLTHTLVAFGAQHININLALVMQKEYAQAHLFGAYVRSNNQTITCTTQQEHCAAHTTSSLVYKGLLTGVSHAAFNGLITIDQTASGSNASQYNKNLLLSPGARATSIPSLQALTNNIQCKHGSAMGKLDEQQLWNMQSRGIAYHDAKNLLMKAFLFDALRGITDSVRAQYIQEQMVNKV